ncbi:MAG TPA: cupredoxin domain-containing protein [Solirubrobacterales bacterium]|nr:cupredoxin domain-containing protein [Solirubrobacterales bacterium]
MLSTRRFAMLFAIGAAVAVPVVGCGGSSNDNNSSSNAATPASTSGGGSTGAGSTVNLTATDFKFDPSDPTVKSGNVTFDMKNDGQVTHSLEIEDVTPGHDQELEGDVSPGSSGKLTANLKPGKYEYYCPIGNHKEMGMEGEITVN